MNNELKDLITKLIDLQERFKIQFGISDIYTNSKIFEILIANGLNHVLIPGHSGSRDAKDDSGEEYEYKHYKETSSNHSWTFNDYTDNTIENIKKCKAVIFAHIDDTKQVKTFDWYYEVPGIVISQYLKEATTSIQNTRKMINVSPKQIELKLDIKKSYPDIPKCKEIYQIYLDEIFKIISTMEDIVKTKEILTSNKIWEILVSIHTGHTILSEQKKHDAVDSLGNYYEYKVAIGRSWQFQDISISVLDKFFEEKAIILATVDKSQLKTLNIFSASPEKIVNLLKDKLERKRLSWEQQGKPLRRLQASISLSDLRKIGAMEIYANSSLPTQTSFP